MSRRLRWIVRPRDPRAVVLLLHGGTDNDTRPVGRFAKTVLRMEPFAWSLRLARPRLAITALSYAVRGWNGHLASPVGDARWALEEIKLAFPGLPIAVVGHSMGARTAVHIADDPAITTLVLLAAWVERSDPVPQRPGLGVLIGHGLADRITKPVGSEYLARRFGEGGADVTLELVPGEGHALLQKARWWHKLVTAYISGRTLS